MKYVFKRLQDNVLKSQVGFYGRVVNPFGLEEPRAKTPLAILEYSHETGLPSPVSCEWEKVSLILTPLASYEEGWGAYWVDERTGNPFGWERFYAGEPQGSPAKLYARTQAVVAFSDGSIRRFQVRYAESYQTYTDHRGRPSLGLPQTYGKRPIVTEIR
jgi:hypothetical protein